MYKFHNETIIKIKDWWMDAEIKRINIFRIKKNKRLNRMG